VRIFHCSEETRGGLDNRRYVCVVVENRSLLIFPGEYSNTAPWKKRIKPKKNSFSKMPEKKRGK
jgi:hypothetical protein